MRVTVSRKPDQSVTIAANGSYPGITVETQADITKLRAAIAKAERLIK